VQYPPNVQWQQQQQPPPPPQQQQWQPNAYDPRYYNPYPPNVQWSQQQQWPPNQPPPQQQQMGVVPQQQQPMGVMPQQQQQPPPPQMRGPPQQQQPQMYVNGVNYGYGGGPGGWNSGGPPPHPSQQYGYPQQQQQFGYPQQNPGYGMANTQMPGQPVQYQQVQYQQVQYQPVQNQPSSPQAFAIEQSPMSGTPREWENSLFGCFSDIGSCLLTICCPCIAYGTVHDSVHQTGCGGACCAFLCLSYIGCSCLIHKDLRGDIRRRYNLDEGCGDCLTTCCCGGCAICQEARELKARGHH